MRLIRTISKNQSKWIRGVNPPVKGNYLVTFLRQDEEISQIYKDLHQGAHLNRLTYDPENNYWYNRKSIVYHKGIKIVVSSSLFYDIVWWDEYGYFNEPHKLKIKFPNDRKENK